MGLSQPLLQVRGLVCMAGFRPLFSDLHLDLAASQWLELTGPNGTGKSTLLRAIAGLIRPADGHLRWRGEGVDTTRAPWRRMLVYQGHAPALKDSLSCAENLSLWLALDHGREFAQRHTHALLERVGLAGCRNVPAASLSAGQRRRAQLARLAAAAARPLWLLDEPGNALDREGLALLRSLLDEHLASGRCAIVATHQALGLAGDRVVLDMPRFAPLSRAAAGRASGISPAP